MMWYIADRLRVSVQIGAEQRVCLICVTYLTYYEVHSELLGVLLF